jgi:hypothetical protein
LTTTSALQRLLQNVKFMPQDSKSVQTSIMLPHTLNTLAEQLAAVEGVPKARILTDAIAIGLVQRCEAYNKMHVFTRLLAKMNAGNVED